MIAKQQENLDELLQDTRRLQEAMEASILAALHEHKAAGNPVAAWQDERVVWLDPQDIEVGPGAVEEDPLDH